MTDGLTEKLVQILSKYCHDDQHDWDKYINSALFAYRTSPLTNSTNMTPFYILYGREARSPCDIGLHPIEFGSQCLEDHVAQTVSKLHVAHEIVHEWFQHHQAYMKKHYNPSQNDVNFRVGDQVYMYVPVDK